MVNVGGRGCAEPQGWIFTVIGIIDYNMGNLGSVQNACRFLNLNARIISDPDRLADCDALILPGVGAFGDCMKHLQDVGFVRPLQTWLEEDKPFLGICLGLQVLFEGSEENPDVPGLGYLPGRVTKFKLPASDFKVPQIGWNQVMSRQEDCPLFRNIEGSSYYYFVHSFYAPVAEDVPVAAVTDYGGEYCSAVCRGRVMAVQFHPEKSQQKGLQMLQNFGAFANEQMGTV